MPFPKKKNHIQLDYYPTSNIDLIQDGALEPGATNPPLFYSFIAEEETDSYVNIIHTQCVITIRRYYKHFSYLFSQKRKTHHRIRNCL